MNRTNLLRLTGLAVGAAALVAFEREASACEPGVCFKNVVQEAVTQRGTTPPIFIRYNTTPGAFPTTAAFVGNNTPDVAGDLEIFPSGEKAEVSYHIAMVRPSTALANNATYTLQVTAEATLCTPQAIEFEFTTASLPAVSLPTISLGADQVTSAPVAPDPSTDCSNGDAAGTRFFASPAVTGDAPALYVLRVRDTYEDAAEASVYPEFTIADVRDSLPLIYDAEKNEGINSDRRLCFVATAITIDGQIAAASAEVCQTLPADGGPPVLVDCPAGAGECEDTGCGCSANSHPLGALLWLTSVGAVLGVLARRRR